MYCVVIQRPWVAFQRPNLKMSLQAFKHTINTYKVLLIHSKAVQSKRQQSHHRLQSFSKPTAFGANFLANTRNPFRFRSNPLHRIHFTSTKHVRKVSFKHAIIYSNSFAHSKCFMFLLNHSVSFLTSSKHNSTSKHTSFLDTKKEIVCRSQSATKQTKTMKKNNFKAIQTC